MIYWKSKIEIICLQLTICVVVCGGRARCPILDCNLLIELQYYKPLFILDTRIFTDSPFTLEYTHLRLQPHAPVLHSEYTRLYQKYTHCNILTSCKLEIELQYYLFILDTRICLLTHLSLKFTHLTLQLKKRKNWEFSQLWSVWVGGSLVQHLDALPSLDNLLSQVCWWCEPLWLHQKCGDHRSICRVSGLDHRLTGDNFLLDWHHTLTKMNFKSFY